MRKTPHLLLKCRLLAFILILQSFYFSAAAITILPAAGDVTITTQPSSTTVCTGANGSFTVVAVNATTYQWQVNQGAGYLNIANGGRYSNANTATLNITGALANMNNYTYRCLMSGTGNPAATTPATLTVRSAPVVTQNPMSNTVCENDNVLFYVAASNATGYQWQANAGAGFVNISDGTQPSGIVYTNTNTAVLYITNAKVSGSGVYYRCVVSGACTPNAVSAAAEFTVLPNVTYYEDYDGDGYGNPAVSMSTCSDPGPGFVTNAGDCNDNDASVHPGAVEICGDGIDNNCNGLIDEGCSTKVQSSQCGTTLATIETAVNADVIASATQYRFRIINGATTMTIDKAVAYFDFTELPSYEYNTTYTIDVAVELNGSFNAYGTACNITTAEPYGIWKGTVNTLWSNPANWSGGALPTATTDVTISSSAPNMPVVDITGAICNDLTINTGASLTINNGQVLTIKGSATNNGTFSAVGKTTFSGDNQIIPGGSFEDLELAGTGTKTLSGTATVSGTLTLTTGNLELGNNNLTIGGSGSITGGSAAHYIVLNGTGNLKQQNIGTSGRTGAITFPIGTTTSYNPLILTNAGTADEFGAGVINDIYDTYDGNDNPTGTAQTTNNVNKTWFVTETVPGGSNVTLTFQWNASDELSGFNRAAAMPAHYTGGNWRPAATTAASGSGPYTIAMSGLTSFSPFGVGSAGSVLPLTLLSFTGKEVSSGIYLQWTTANEVNTEAFDIERSANGKDFTKIGSVAAGTSNAYSYTDNNPFDGATIYRLKMRDKDSKYSYSPIVSVKMAAKMALNYSIYPNPTTGSYLYIKSPATTNANLQIAIVDLAGRTWYTHTFTSADLNNGRYEVPVKQLSAGTYVLKISDKNGTSSQAITFKVGN